MSDIQKASIDAIADRIPAEAGEGTSNWGNPFPLAMKGTTVLVLACGAGRDAFIAGKLAGPQGRVVGVEQRNDLVASANSIKERLGSDNVEFVCGNPTSLDGLSIEDDSIDLVIAHGAISRSEDVQAQLSSIWRVLKFGGELYVTDVFADRRTPQDKRTPVLEKLGLAGAPYVEDFRRFCFAAGWPTVRCMSTAVYRKEQPAEVADWTYFVRSMRTYKLPGVLEDLCEQYYQTATYRGGIEDAPDYYDLDNHHRFVKDEPLAVCGNSCAMVQDTRVGAYFEIEGDRSVHGGPFPGCGNVPYSAEDVWE